MAKNAMLAKMEAKYEAKYAALFHRRMDTLLQMCQDAACIAAHNALGMGPGRAENFCAEYRLTINRMSEMALEDAKDDEDIWYTKEKLDEELRAIVGPDKFAPFEERYYQNKNP